MFSRHPIRAAGALLLIGGLLAFSSGCANKYKARAVVKGKVTFEGKPLTTGSVMFYGKNNVTGSATIDTSGNYIMNDAPIGEVKVTVSVPRAPAGSGPAFTMPAAAMKNVQGSVNPENPNQKITMPSMMGEVPKNIVTIPDKYASPDTSGITYTVEKGEHVFDINLK